MSEFDHMVPESCRITLETGLIMGENVGLVDPETQWPSANRRLHKVTHIDGDKVTVARRSDDGKEEITMVVSRSEIFAFGVIQSLYEGYGAENIISSRKKLTDK